MRSSGEQTPFAIATLAKPLPLVRRRWSPPMGHPRAGLPQTLLGAGGETRPSAASRCGVAPRLRATCPTVPRSRPDGSTGAELKKAIPQGAQCVDHPAAVLAYERELLVLDDAGGRSKVLGSQAAVCIQDDVRGG
jgi:hypothetical protein